MSLKLQPVIDVAERAAKAEAENELPKTIEVNGRLYWANNQQLVVPPTIGSIAAHTLSAIAEYVKRNPDNQKAEDFYLLIDGTNKVRVMGQPDELTKVRPVFLTAQASERWKAFGQPGQKLKPENFIVWLLGGFAPSADRDYLLNLARSLKTESVREASDNGIAQAVAIKKGVKSDFQEVKLSLLLHPWRTFAEIEPPPMQFIVRMYDGGENEPPTLCLYDADSGQWEVTATAAIKAWLTEQLPEIAIVG